MCLSNCNPAPLSNGHLSNFLWRSATVTPEWKTSVAGTWSILPCKHSVMILIFHSRITVAFLHKKLDNVQFPIDYQSSLLHYACWNGWHDVSRKLVDKYQCDPYPENKWKYTPLHWACKGGSMDKETCWSVFMIMSLPPLTRSELCDCCLDTPTPSEWGRSGIWLITGVTMIKPDNVYDVTHTIYHTLFLRERSAITSKHKLNYSVSTSPTLINDVTHMLSSSWLRPVLYIPLDLGDMIVV